MKYFDSHQSEQKPVHRGNFREIFWPFSELIQGIFSANGKTVKVFLVSRALE